jgi:molecular chaperone HtpG
MNKIKFGKRLLETLTAALYSEPAVIFREYVQNSVDSFIANEAKKQKDFKIDINIDIENRIIKIKDNGYGIEPKLFLEKMRGISSSEKSKDEIGFRGIGRLSGMSFCKKLIFYNKHETSDTIQIFQWENEAYKKILNTDIEADLDIVIKQITENAEKKREDSTHFFEVEMCEIEESLLKYISVQDQKTGKKILSGNFITLISNMLPIPYGKEFSYAAKIHDEYYKIFSESLSRYEFIINLNDEPLYKTYNDNDIRENNIHFIPIKLKYKENEEENEENIGVIWLSFDYKFKAYSGNYGISVRSKNMLLNDKAILADEAVKSLMAITTHGQYVSAIKCVIGEFLIKTNILKDNSKRDWFKTDANSLQLREIICEFLSNMHSYRYKASAFFNKKDDDRKRALLEAFEKFVTSTSLEKIADKCVKHQELKENSSNEIDPIADGDEIPSYNNTRKQFYEKLMKIIYEYYDKKDKTENYYELKAYILKKLNDE